MTLVMLSARHVAVGAAALVVGAAGWWWVASRSAPPVSPPSFDLSVLDGDIAEAIRQAHEEVVAHPDDGRAWRHLAAVYDANDVPEAARTCYENAVRLEPADGRSWYDLAVVRAGLGDRRGAIAAMQRTIELSPDYPPARWRLGFWLLQRGDLDDAEAAFTAATVFDAEHSIALIGLGRVWLQREAYEQAAEVLGRVAESGGGNAHHASQLLARAYRHLGRLDEAEAAALRGLGAGLVEEDPWRTELEQYRAGLTTTMREAGRLLQEGKNDKAVALMERLRWKHPRWVGVLTALGTTYRSAGRHDQSLGVLEEVLTIESTYYPAHLELARTYARKSERVPAADARRLQDRAMRHLDRAVELNSSYAAAHALRGDLLAIRQDHAGAVASYREAARCDPTNPNWEYRLGEAHFQMEQWAEAVESLETVTRRAPSTAQAFYMLGVARLHLGQLPRAETALLRAQELAPQNPATEAALRQLRSKRAADE